MGYNHSGNLNTTSFSMNERPNVKAGASNNPILGGQERYWDINAFELPAANQRGNLGRNTLIGPNLRNFDVSFGKAFSLSEERSVQFRTEIFNVANHPNFAVPSGLVSFTNASSRSLAHLGTHYVHGDDVTADSISLEADVLNAQVCSRCQSPRLHT
jgi:hypothetical protein